MADADKQAKYGKVGAGCGIAVAVLSALTFLITLVLAITSDGRISMDEAAPALLGAGCCGAIGGVGAVGGLVVVLRARKQSAQSPGQGPLQ